LHRHDHQVGQAGDDGGAEAYMRSRIDQGEVLTLAAGGLEQLQEQRRLARKKRKQQPPV
jgi:hypothetical protein